MEVRLGQAVKAIDEAHVLIGDESIPCRTVIWTAGVTPSPAGKWLNAPTDRAGRVRVQPDCSVPEHPEVFVIGDTASLDQDGKPLPGVAQVAMQEGHYVGKVIGNKRDRAARASAVSVLRQRQHGGNRPWICHSGFTLRETERPAGMAGMGFRPPYVSPRGGEPDSGLDTGDVVLLYSPAQLAAYRGAASQRGAGDIADQPSARPGSALEPTSAFK